MKRGARQIHKSQRKLRQQMFAFLQICANEALTVKYCTIQLYMALNHLNLLSLTNNSAHSTQNQVTNFQAAKYYQIINI
jgi:hypothetical protein